MNHVSVVGNISERLFSRSKLVYGDKRGSLGPSILDFWDDCLVQEIYKEEANRRAEARYALKQLLPAHEAG